MGTVLLMLLSLSVGGEPNAPEAEQSWRAQEQSWREKFQQANKSFKPTVPKAEPAVELTPLPRSKRIVQGGETIDRRGLNQYAIIPVPRGFQVVHLANGRIVPVSGPWDSAAAAQLAVQDLASRAAIAPKPDSAVKKPAVPIKHRDARPATNRKSIVENAGASADQRPRVQAALQEK